MSDCACSCHAPPESGSAAADPGEVLLEALTDGLIALAEHTWGKPQHADSLRPHYRRQAEQHLLPHLAPLLPTRPDPEVA